MSCAPTSMDLCDLCVYAKLKNPVKGVRLCSMCGALLCNKHTHVYGKHPRCVDCQKNTEAGD